MSFDLVPKWNSFILKLNPGHDNFWGGQRNLLRIDEIEFDDLQLKSSVIDV
jgi:hypothetical protein